MPHFFGLTVFSFAVVQCISCRPSSSLVNFHHLEHLTEKINFFGEEVSVVHVYANYPGYEWVGAKESGPEGIACVDDAARAAVLYLRDFELRGDQTSLAKARSLLKFVTKMQTEDGQFFNFIFVDHSINREGKTSYKSFGWWAARGVWAMATGYRVMKNVDPVFAAALKSGVERALPYVKKLLETYGDTKIIGSYRIPCWLLYESGADVVSELLLGLSEYYADTHDEQVKGFIEQLAAGVMLMQDGDERTFPFGLHRSWKTIWHMWGNGQTQALACAGRVLSDSTMIASAEREARGFYSRLLMNGFFKEMDVGHPDVKVQFEQIAYGVRPMAVGLIRLYEATSNVEYLTMAALAASWFFDNNVMGKPIYDLTTGRCYDGIRDSATMNKNSGAESTIEALYTLIELEQYPQAMKYLTYHRIRSGSTPQYVYGLFKDNSDNQLTLAIDLKTKTLILLEGTESKAFQGKLR